MNPRPRAANCPHCILEFNVELQCKRPHNKTYLCRQGSQSRWLNRRTRETRVDVNSFSRIEVFSNRVQLCFTYNNLARQINQTKYWCNLWGWVSLKWYNGPIDSFLLALLRASRVVVDFQKHCTHWVLSHPFLALCVQMIYICMATVNLFGVCGKIDSGLTRCQIAIAIVVIVICSRGW